MIYIFIVFCVYIIFAILSTDGRFSIQISENEYLYPLFNKRKVMKITYASGKCDYIIKVNGCMGIPFLYQKDYKAPMKSYKTEEAARQYITLLKEYYNERKVVNKKIIS